ncbi:hypothetical protein J1605_018046 [Eschrichtius robustus]|uniref:Ciliary microtubule inner protein 2C n=1 Tax=Eschrichtius robustus TaxID=9764 RepID=A0AB34I0X4_ESCRO|nr:hypothetical protein J1605_018046 [Eschrichtius robustus]
MACHTPNKNGALPWNRTVTLTARKCKGSSWAVYLRKPLKARRYQGHVPGVAFSFGSPYGTTTLKYFQEQRNAEKSHTAFRKGGHFPTSLSPNPNQVLSDRSRTRDHWLYAPSCTRFNLDSSRAAELSRFYQMTQQHREYYQDKTGMAPRVPYFVLPVREWERYPTPTDLSTAIIVIITITITIITITITITIITITINITNHHQHHHHHQ